MGYRLNPEADTNYHSGHGEAIHVDPAKFIDAIAEAHNVIDAIAGFQVDIFSILGMRNLSAFIGELYAASLITSLGGDYCKNPHQDGYPDLLLMNARGRSDFAALERGNQVRDKAPFSPFPNGGIEVKATCGAVPTDTRCRALGLDCKPGIGDQRIGVMTGYDWKAHHRDTNNLVGILWDFIDRAPRIAAVFFGTTLTTDDWGAIVQPKKGGGRTTSVSIMTRAGVAKMYRQWVAVIDDDPRYATFLDRHNRGALMSPPPIRAYAAGLGG